jgi:dTDP-4-dehydrorhamnose reductase
MDILETKEFESGIQHVTDGKAMSWYEFAQIILQENTLDGEVEVVRDKNYRTFAKRPVNSVLI